jgi:hypothetical protein
MINLDKDYNPYEKLLYNPSIYLDKNKKYYFYCKNGNIVKFFHDKQCCECVFLADADGLTNGVDIFTDCDWCEVEEIIKDDTDKDTKPIDEYDYNYTWTFYKFKTNKGYDTMRWYGTSNGFYSESVDFEIYKE